MVVEAVAGFEVGEERRDSEGGIREARFERWRSGVQETVGGVDHPDGEEHGGWLGPGEMEMGAAGDEDGPECGDCGGVEREEMPESESGVAGARRRDELGARGGCADPCLKGETWGTQLCRCWRGCRWV